MGTVIVCGGCRYDDVERVFEVLDSIHSSEDGPIDLIVQGGAQGADLCALMWAHDRKIENKSYPAKWDQYGIAAGPIRNALMLDDHGDGAIVVAFPGGRGTGNMIGTAKYGGFKVVEIES